MSAERGVVYIDASALVKLVLPEPESAALAETVASGLELISSVVGAIETRRAVLAAMEGEPLSEKVEEILETVTLIGITEPIRRAASVLRPTLLRTLDAIHLATALSFGDELDAVIAYDRRLRDAAEAAALRVLVPA